MVRTELVSLTSQALFDDPLLTGSVSEWNAADSAKAFHNAAETVECMKRLAPILSLDRPMTPSAGFPFNPASGNTWAEVVDFELPTSLLPADRRAFEYYVMDFRE